MNPMVSYNNAIDAVPSRRYTGFPLNSTLVSSYTPDTIRSIITHAAAGQPYTTAVWIRISRLGIRISAQDPQVASTRVPVFIPIALAHDIFMQPTINNVICIVYDELQSNMKGVLLYVVQPADAQLLRDDFRLVKQANNAQQAQPSPYSNPIDTRFVNGNSANLPPPPPPPVEVHSNLSPYPVDNNKPMFSPLPSHGSPPITTEVYRNGNLSGTPIQPRRQTSPRRIFYVRDHETGTNRVFSPVSGVPPPLSNLPQLSYTPFRSSYHSSREEGAHRRHKSPRKNKQNHSAGKPSSDTGGKHRRKYRSRSPEKQVKPRLPANNNSSHELTQDQLLQQQQLRLQQQQQLAVWQASQMAPVPIGIYNRYVPKTIPLPTGETLKTTISPAGTTGGLTNGAAIAFIEPKMKAIGRAQSRSPSPSRSHSPQQRHRPSSAHNADASIHHHHHHHHRRNHGIGNNNNNNNHHTNNNNNFNSKPETNLYGTISQSSRSRMKYMATTTPNEDNDLKQYLKLLLDEVQTVKTEMNKIRQISSTGVSKGRSDSLRIDLKEIRADIDLIRSRMAATPKIPE